MECEYNFLNIIKDKFLRKKKIQKHKKGPTPAKSSSKRSMKRRNRIKEWKRIHAD